MTTPTQAPQPRPTRHFAESEDSMWESQGSQLLDPRPIEPRMEVAAPGSDSGWGFHLRAELLNGRLAMLGFGIGLVVEALSGQGILQQLGFGALLPQG